MVELNTLMRPRLPSIPTEEDAANAIIERNWRKAHSDALVELNRSVWQDLVSLRDAIANLSVGTNDANAFHKNVANEINALAPVSPTINDVLVIEASGANYGKRKILYSDIVAGNTTDANAFHKNVGNEINALTEKTPIANDVLLIEDSAASYVKKKIKISAITATDANAFHKDANNEIFALTETTPAANDILVVEQANANYVKKKIKIANITSTDANAYHRDIANEVTLLTEKTTPVANDVVFIEDSAAGYAKKKLRIVNFPGFGGGEPGLKVLGETGYTTLSEAITTIGPASITLIIPDGAINIATNITVPSNIELLLLRGAIFNIASGITLTINGPIRAGNNRHFTFGSTSSRLALGVKEVNAVWFTSAGDGTSSSKWIGPNGKAGIGEAIDYVYQTAADFGSGLIIHLPAGHFEATVTIDVKYNGIHIIGEGARNHNAGGTTNIWFTPSGNDTMFYFNGSFLSYEIYGCSLRQIALRNSDPNKQNVGIYLADASGCTFSDLTFVHGGTGAWQSSYGIKIHGRDMCIFERIYLDKVKWPIYIGHWEGYGADPTYEADAFIFRDIWMWCSNNEATGACVTLADGIRITECGFKGWISMSGGTYGLYWNDTSSTDECHGLHIDNIKSESGGVAATGYVVYINRPNAQMDNVQIKNVEDMHRQGGGVYLRGCRNVKLSNVLYYPASGSGYAVNAAAIENLIIENLYTNRSSSLTSMNKAIGVTVGNNIPFAVYTVGTPAVSHM